jgi:hypothetical protein
MEVAATTSVWAVLWPVIVGGLIGVIATAIGPTITHMLTVKAAKKEKREKLFGSMIESLFEFDHWLDLKKDSYVYGVEKDLPYSPLSKAIAVASMHFPKVLPALHDLDIKATEYQQWMTEASARRNAGKIDTLNNGFKEVYKPYAEAMLLFQVNIPAMVKEYKVTA